MICCIWYLVEEFEFKAHSLSELSGGLEGGSVEQDMFSDSILGYCVAGASTSRAGFGRERSRLVSRLLGGGRLQWGVRKGVILQFV